MITLYKTDQHDRIHYYSINDRQGHLFSPYNFTVNWGPRDDRRARKGSRVRVAQGHGPKLQELIQSRIDAGYRVLYSYFRNHEYEHLRPALRRASVS